MIVAIVAAVGGLSYASITAPAPVKEPIKIALLYCPTISALKVQGEAAKLAIEEINRAGGIAGHTIEYREWDTQKKVDVAVAAYREALAWGARFVILEGVSEEMIALMEEGAKLYPRYPHVLMYAGTASTVTIKIMEEYDKYKFAFRIFDTDYAGITYRWTAWLWEAKHTLGVNKVALLFEEAAWNFVNREGINRTVTIKAGDVTKTVTIAVKPLREIAKDLGLTVVYEANIPVGTKEFIPFLELAKAAGAECILVASSWYTDTTTLVKQWAASGARDAYLILNAGPNMWTTFWNLTGSAALGVISGLGVFDVPDYPPLTPYTRSHIKSMVDRGLPVDQGTHYYYSVIYHIKRAIEHVVEHGGSPFDIDAIIKALEEQPCDRHTLLPPELAVLGNLDENFHSYRPLVPPMFQFQRNGEVVCISNPDNPFYTVPDHIAKSCFHPELVKSPAELRAGS